MEVPATIAAGLMAVVALFQLALAAGAPWGQAAWGGTHQGVLPQRLRFASGFAAVVVYPVLALYVLAAGGVIEAAWLPDWGAAGMWVLTALFGLGTLANAASRSPIERWWAPLSGAVAVCCGIVAASL